MTDPNRCVYLLFEIQRPGHETYLGAFATTEAAQRRAAELRGHDLQWQLIPLGVGKYAGLGDYVTGYGPGQYAIRQATIHE